MTRPPFFTWFDDTYKSSDQIPERICEFMRVSWLDGAEVGELAELFHVPVDWVETIVREEPRTTPH
jgi:hypothetical protein